MRIAIANDLPLAVEAMRRIIVASGGHELAWIARDGREAVERCLRDRPDLILMDLIMPRLDGVQATRRIMTEAPCAILVVTANMTENQGKVFEAMGVGALDAVNTPVLGFPDSHKGAEALLAKIETIAKLVGAADPRRVSRHLHHLARATPRPEWLVAVGASAGGPSALAHILAKLPADFPAAIVVVQHVDAQFAPGLASWLDCQTPLNVRLARDGESVQAGTVLLADGDQHLVLTRPGRLGYADQPLEVSYRPSIDVFFKSIERHWEGEVIGLLLTGMGRDGAQGLHDLRVSGHHTLVQDQASCAVYGMPKAAVELGAASEILALDSIVPRLLQLVCAQAKSFAIHERA